MAKAAASTSKAGQSLVTLKVTLKESKPPIWRRILVPGSFTLGSLSDVILASMGWRGGHLHAFTVDGRDDGDSGRLEDAADENRLTLDGVIRQGVKRFGYMYDFGDSWDHVIAIEKTEPAPAGQGGLRCVAGKRHCPPDDCGGVWGYAELLDILADPTHPERAERLDWMETDDFDPEAFDLDAVNTILAAIAKRI